MLVTSIIITSNRAGIALSYGISWLVTGPSQVKSILLIEAAFAIVILMAIIVDQCFFLPLPLMPPSVVTLYFVCSRVFACECVEKRGRVVGGVFPFLFVCWLPAFFYYGKQRFWVPSGWDFRPSLSLSEEY